MFIILTGVAAWSWFPYLSVCVIILCAANDGAINYQKEEILILKRFYYEHIFDLPYLTEVSFCLSS